MGIFAARRNPFVVICEHKIAWNFVMNEFTLSDEVFLAELIRDPHNDD